MYGCFRLARYDPFQMRPECAIMIGFDTSEYPNAFVSRKFSEYLNIFV